MGRPPKYSDPTGMQRAMDAYFESCNGRDRPTITGLAMALGLTRRGLLDYQARGAFTWTVTAAKLRIESDLESRLYGSDVAGVIFNLRNNFGWRRRSDIRSSGHIAIVVSGS